MYNDIGYGSTYETSSAVGGIFAISMIITWLIIIGISVFMIITMWKIFKKNNKEGWWALIPYANTWMLFEISGVHGWLSLIPFINMIFSYVAAYKLAMKMKNNVGIAVVTMLLPLIGYPILAFSKDSGNVQENLEQNNPTENSNLFSQPVANPNPINNGMNNVNNQQNITNTVNTIGVPVNNTINNAPATPVSNQESMINPVNNVNPNNTIPNQVVNNYKKCQNCGNVLTSDSVFCTNCGNKVM